MKLYPLFFLVTLFGIKAQAGIQSVSNISEDRVAVNVIDHKSKDNVLKLVNLSNLEKKSIILPKMENEEVIGMALVEGKLVLISQWVAGGGKEPNVHQYDIKTKAWSKPIQVNCKSFDTIEVKKQTLKIFCEGGSSQSVKLGFKARKALKLTFPLEKDKSGQSVAYKLSGGDMFNWESLVILSKGKSKKSITVSDLLKK